MRGDDELIGAPCTVAPAQAGVHQARATGATGLSFPLAAFAALTFTLAQDAAFALLGMLALAVASVVIGWLALPTVRGLARGELLAAEPAPRPAAAP